MKKYLLLLLILFLTNYLCLSADKSDLENFKKFTESFQSKLIKIDYKNINSIDSALNKEIVLGRGGDAYYSYESFNKSEILNIIHEIQDLLKKQCKVEIQKKSYIDFFSFAEKPKKTLNRYKFFKALNQLYSIQYCECWEEEENQPGGCICLELFFISVNYSFKLVGILWGG
mgnify:CR=1 FL=1